MHEMVNFTIIPCVFELTYHFSDKNPLFAGLVLAMSPLSDAFYSIVLNKWVETGKFKIPMIFGQIMFFLSSILYVYSYKNKEKSMLLTSRFLFGIAGS